MKMGELDYIVVDTEGKETLSEIAIVNSNGELVYQAYTEDNSGKRTFRHQCYPLNDIVEHFRQLAQGKRVICHYAVHDCKVLQRSFERVGLAWEPLEFDCTYELSRELFPGLAQYSLEFLSKQFLIKVEDQWFSRERAHVAQYDALFTYALYQWLREHRMRQNLSGQLKTLPNPFSSSRVDTPFQDHPDLETAYHAEYETLKSVLQDIKDDPNHQSRGAIVLGEPGSGKTHLMMRLAKQLLKKNGLLFIRQPNNASAVLYHTYARILESFAQRVPGTEHTQFEQ